MIKKLFQKLFQKKYKIQKKYKKKYYFNTLLDQSIKDCIIIPEITKKYINDFNNFFHKTIRKIIEFFGFFVKNDIYKITLFYNIVRLKLNHSNSIIDYTFRNNMASFLYMIKNKKGKFEWY